MRPINSTDPIDRIYDQILNYKLTKQTDGIFNKETLKPWQDFEDIDLPQLKINSN